MKKQAQFRLTKKGFSTKLFGMVAAAAVMGTNLYSAVLLPKHVGDNDPLDEGWIFVPTPLADHHVSAVDNAWQIWDNNTTATTPGKLMYSYSTESVKEQAKLGWTLQMTASVFETSTSTAAALRIGDSTSKQYYFYFDSTGSTTKLIALRASGGNMIFDTGLSGYIDYNFVFNGTDLSVYINGSSTASISGYGGFNPGGTANAVEVGFNSTTGTGKMELRSLEYALIPEASTTLSFVSGAGVLALGASRLRKRNRV